MKSTWMRWNLLVPLAGLVLGCGLGSTNGGSGADALQADGGTASDGGPLADGGLSGGGTLPDGGALPCDGGVTLSQVQADVFTPQCAGCHQGTSASAALSLEAGWSFGQLVGITSTIAPAKLRVVPGDVANSFLIQKLTGNLQSSDGELMPPGSPLSQAQIDEVTCWVGQGAKNN